MANRERRTDRSAYARAWQSMRIMMRFDRAQLEITSEISSSGAQRYLTALRRAGYLRVVREAQGGPAGRAAIYQLINNSGPMPPQLWSDGTVFDPNIREKVYVPEHRQRSASAEGVPESARRQPLCERLWQAMRQRKRFTTVDLAQDCGCSERSIRAYLSRYLATGFVQVRAECIRVSGRKRNMKEYQLVRDTGPLHPQFRQGGPVYDQNTGKIHEPIGEQGHA